MGSDKFITLAKIAERVERYDDMATFLGKLVTVKQAWLSNEERHLLSVAFDMSIQEKRSALGIVRALEQGDLEIDVNTQLVSAYRERIEKEIEQQCEVLLTLITNHLQHVIGGIHDAEVFVYKMKGDCLRYLAEISSNDKLESRAAKSFEAYNKAYLIAERFLQPTHPLRMTLALNFSILHHEILKDTGKACDLAKRAFDNAIGDIDEIEEESYKESMSVIELLRDNLQKWESEQN